MERFKKLLPAILMILFEIAVGVILLINPEKFTIAIFVIFGCVLILCALIMMIRYIKERKAAQKAFSEAKRKAKKDGVAVNAVEAPRVSPLPMITAIVTFIFGAVFAFGAGALYNLTLLLVIFYGAIMIIKGIFKISEYASLRREKVSVSAMRLAVGVLSVIVGVVMIIFSGGARDLMFTVAAISLFVEALLDIITIFMSGRLSGRTEAKIVTVSVNDDDH